MKRKIFSKLLMGAFLIASVSMFVSCKDYDDDINKNAADIQALKSQLGTDISGLKSELTSQLATVNSQIDQLKTQIADKASKSDVTAGLATKADATELANLVARVAALESQIGALNDIQAALATKADAASVEALSGQLAAISGNMANFIDEAKAKEIAEAALKTLDIQGEALKVFQNNITAALSPYVTTEALDAKGYLTQKDLETITANVGDLQKLMTAEYKAKIDELLDTKFLSLQDVNDAINNAEFQQTLKDLEKAFQGLNDSIDKRVSASLSTINIFVNKKLTSIVLKPNFYWEGIEGIEAPFIYQTPVFEEKGKYSFSYQLTDDPAGDRLVDVNVEKSMGWKGFSEKRELAKYVFKGPEAAHALYPVYTVNGTKLDYDMTAKDNKGVTKVDVAYGAVAKYNLNPSIANIEKATIGFFENDAPVYTRAAGLSIKPAVIADDVKNNAGLLTVPFTVDYEAVIKYFVDWTNSQTPNWEGHNLAAKEDWSKLWYEVPAPTNAIYGSDDADVAVNGCDQFVYNANLPFVSLKIDVPADEEKGQDAYTVNSDWALVVPALYQIVALADKDPQVVLDQNTFTKPSGKHEIRKNHLYETVGYNDSGIRAMDANASTQRWNDEKGYGAIPMPATHSLVYNDAEGIDLMDYVETHYNYLTVAQYGKSKYDAVLDTEDNGDLMKKLGLSYKFTPIHYTIGNEVTSETAHVTQHASNKYKDKDGNALNSRFIARSVETTGVKPGDYKTIEDKPATREAIDREPLIRVDLVDAKGNIIRYGYIKIRIVDATAVSKDYEVSIPMDELYMNCGDEGKIQWHQVENLILAKLGDGEGFTKQEFENYYYLDVYGGYKNMPYIKPENNTQAKADGDPAGTLYSSTWMAKRYFKNGNSYQAALDESNLGKWTTTNNHFGEVWYTPHDNSTEGHNWDEQTNVLIWNLYPGVVDRTAKGTTVGKENAGNMDGAKYKKLIELTGANYSNQGKSQKEISTVVRFINKISGTSIWVTLQVPEKKISFAYADVNKRVLDHWYDFKTGYKDNTPDTIEVYANVPTPAEINRATGITVSGFTKNLTEYWLNQNINDAVVFHGNVAKFNKFTGGKSNVTFRFRLPEQGVNADFSADAKGQWTAPGASGATWTVELNAAKTEIVAVAKNGAPYGPTVICSLTPQGTIHWNGRTEGAKLFDNKAIAPNKEDVNEPANDILNYIGMFDKKGNNQKKTYLSGQKDKTFAAYVEVVVTNDCYDPLIGKNYFNVRFLRPINVWPTETNWTDAPNTTQVYDIWRLINIRDWRTYAVVLDNQKQKLDDSNITYEGKFVDGEKASVPYSFYNITNVYVERAAITSDAYLEPLKRVITDNPGSLLTIDQIPALTGKNDGVVNWEYLKIMPVGTSTEVAGKTAIGLPESTQSGDILAYTNNGGVVKPFHVYVPIKVVYSHGALKPWTQTVWAVITIDPTVGNE